MKKYAYIIPCVIGMFLYSCSSDDMNNNSNPIVNPDPTDEIKVESEWEPSTIQLIKIIPIYTLDYPHTANCKKDFLQLLSNNTAKYYRYENTACDETKYENAFVRAENSVSLNVLGYQIKGTITAETDSKMEVTSDISQYTPIIKVMYPEYEQYLEVLEGGTVKLTLNKK